MPPQADEIQSGKPRAIAERQSDPVRPDSQEPATREIVDPVLKVDTPVYEYEPNTWGPSEVDEKVSPTQGWQNPIVTG